MASSSMQLKRNENDQEENLDLRGMALNTLPKYPLDFSLIKAIDISCNNLEVISDSVVAGLSNVVDFDVHSNQLKSLPDSIGCLTKLKRLNFSGNLITFLPNGLRLCRALEELNGNFNSLTTLPVSFGYEHQNLKSLVLSSNKLSYLPNSITRMVELKHLDVGLNKLYALPEGMENLTKLEVLIIRQNFHFLRRLPFGIGLLKELKEFDLSYNMISVLPHSMSCLNELTVLNIEGNPIKSPPMEVVNKGIIEVRSYLNRKMHGIEENPNKTSWLNKMARYATFSGTAGMTSSPPSTSSSPELLDEHDDDWVRVERRTMEAVASPRFLKKLSPRMLFKSSRK